MPERRLLASRWPNLARAAVFAVVTAAGATAAPVERSTDVVELSSGDELRGAILERLPGGALRVAVQRDWLAAHPPRDLDGFLAEERERTAAARRDLRDRIERAIAETPEEHAFLLAFLRQERDRAGADGPADSQFALLAVPAKKVRRGRAASPAASRVARWAWSERLADVESLPPATLRAALEDRGIDPTTEPPDLSGRLPPVPEDDRQWQARLALAEDAFVAPVAFQGVGGALVRVGDDQPGIDALMPMLGELVGGGGGLADLLGELGGTPAVPRRDDRWLDAARGQAREGRYRATRVTVDAAAGLATVESVFEVRLADGGWVRLWQDRRQADAAHAPPGAVDRITSDPRIAPALEAVRGVGLVDEATITRALAVGAATQAAQQAGDAAFAEFRERFTRRLDGPPLTLP